MKKIYTRIAVCFLAALFTFNVFAVPQAKAVVGTTTLGTAALASYMTATGIPLTVISGGAGAAASGASAVAAGYAAATGTTTASVLGSIAAGTTISASGAIILSVAAVALLAGIVSWAVNQFSGTGQDDVSLSLPSSADGFAFIDNNSPTGYTECKFSQIVYTDGEPYVIKGTNFTEIDMGIDRYLQADSQYTKYLYMQGTYPNFTGIDFTCWKDAASGKNLYIENTRGDYIIRDDVGQQLIFTDLTTDGSGYHRLLNPKYFPYDNYPWMIDFFGFTPDEIVFNGTSNYEPPPEFNEAQQMVIDVGAPAGVTEDGFANYVFDSIANNTFAPTYTIEPDITVDPDNPDIDPDPSPELDPDADTQLGLLGRIAKGIDGLAEAIKNGIASLFAPDPVLMQEITDTFSSKFDFISTLHGLGTDLLNLNPDQTPPVIYIHLNDAQSNYGFDYGGTTKALDMAWYEPYKEDVDRIISGFLWLGFLWLVFMRISDIINGAGMVYAAGQPTIYTPEPPHDAPRLDAPRWRRRGR